MLWQSQEIWESGVSRMGYLSWGKERESGMEKRTKRKEKEKEKDQRTPAGAANGEGRSDLGRRKKTRGKFGPNLPVLEREPKYVIVKNPGKAINAFGMFMALPFDR